MKKYILTIILVIVFSPVLTSVITKAENILFNKRIECTINGMGTTYYYADNVAVNVKNGVFSVNYRDGREHLVSGNCVVIGVKDAYTPSRF